MGWNYVSIRKLQQCCHWNLGMGKKFHPTLHWACDYLPILLDKSIHIVPSLQLPDSMHKIVPWLQTKRLWKTWFGTPSLLSWRHCNAIGCPWERFMAFIGVFKYDQLSRSRFYTTHFPRYNRPCYIDKVLIIYFLFAGEFPVICSLNGEFIANLVVHVFSSTNPFTHW